MASVDNLAVSKMLTLLTIELLAHVPNADNCQHQIPQGVLHSLAAHGSIVKPRRDECTPCGVSGRGMHV